MNKQDLVFPWCLQTRQININLIYNLMQIPFLSGKSATYQAVNCTNK